MVFSHKCGLNTRYVLSTVYHDTAKMPDQIEKLKLEYFTSTIAEYFVKR